MRLLVHEYASVARTLTYWKATSEQQDLQVWICSFYMKIISSNKTCCWTWVQKGGSAPHKLILHQEVTHTEQHFSLLWWVLAKGQGSNIPMNFTAFTSYYNFLHWSSWSHTGPPLAEAWEEYHFALFSSTFIHKSYKKLHFPAGKKA